MSQAGSQGRACRCRAPVRARPGAPGRFCPGHPAAEIPSLTAPLGVFRAPRIGRNERRAVASRRDSRERASIACRKRTGVVPPFRNPEVDSVE